MDQSTRQRNYWWIKGSGGFWASEAIKHANLNKCTPETALLHHLYSYSSNLMQGCGNLATKLSLLVCQHLVITMYMVTVSNPSLLQSCPKYEPHNALLMHLVAVKLPSTIPTKSSATSLHRDKNWAIQISQQEMMKSMHFIYCFQ